MCLARFQSRLRLRLLRLHLMQSRLRLTDQSSGSLHGRRGLYVIRLRFLEGLSQSVINLAHDTANFTNQMFGLAQDMQVQCDNPNVSFPFSGIAQGVIWGIVAFYTYKPREASA